MTATTPRHEIEVLVAQNRRTIAEQGLPEGWISQTEAVEVMIRAAVVGGASHAERAFLGAVGVSLSRADKAIASCIGDLFAEIRRAADFLDLTEAERTRMEGDAAILFDARLGELQAVAIRQWGRA